MGIRISLEVLEFKRKNFDFFVIQDGILKLIRDSDNNY